MLQSICMWNISQNEWSVPEKMAKNCQKHLIWTQNGQKQGDRIFFRAWCHNKKCTECSNLLKYAKLAKTNEAFSRKWQKTASSLLFPCYRLTCCKKAKKSYGRKYENFCCGQTDWQTEANLKDQSVGPKKCDRTTDWGTDDPIWKSRSSVIRYMIHTSSGFWSPTFP